MRTLHFLSAGLLAMAAANAATPAIKAGVAYQGAVIDNADYRPGMGLNGSVASEKPILGANGVGGLGLRANYEHYRHEGVSGMNEANLNEGGIALTGMVGPNTIAFQPKVGGHVGYARLDDRNFVEVGPDLAAAYKVSPTVGIQALVTPTWMMNQDNTDFHGTKVGLGVTWSARDI